VLILTSNVGTGTLMRHWQADGKKADPAKLLEVLRPELQHEFKPAFLGRLTVVPYYPVKDEVLKQIVKLKLGKIARRIRENHKAELAYADELIDEVVSRCTEVDSGARNIDYVLTGTLLPQISETVLTRMAAGHAISRVSVSVDAKTKDLQYEVD
jgi:type VI secretion system protein VasG